MLVFLRDPACVHGVGLDFTLLTNSAGYDRHPRRMKLIHLQLWIDD